MSTPTLFICLQCGMKQRDETGKKLPNPAASQLAGEVMALLNDTPLQVVLTRCLEQCDAPIAWALRDDTKFAYTFAPATCAEDLAATARAYLATPAGEKLTKSNMPEAVRRTVAARIPPLGA